MQPSYMGQDLLNPPSVEGWHTGSEWINSGSLMARINFVAEQVGNTSTCRACRPSSTGLQKMGVLEPEQLVDSCLDLLGPVEVGRRHASKVLTEQAQAVGTDPLGHDGEHAGGRQAHRRAAAADRRDPRVSIRLTDKSDKKDDGGNVTWPQRKRTPCWSSLQLTGGNDYLNTVIPYNNPLYRDNRKAVSIGDNQHHAARQDLRHPVVPGAHEAILGRRQARHHAWRRATSIRRARISAPWTSGTPASPTRSAPRAGWAAWCASSTRRRTTWSPPSASARACSAPCPCRACRWPAWRARSRPTASCRVSRTSSSASRCSIASRGCTSRIEAAV